MERIKISNFRSVKDSWDLELGPITFFTGKNNSGKSTVLKALMVLSDFVNSDNHLELNFRGKNRIGHKVASYKDAINWDNFDEGDSELGICFQIGEFETTLMFEPLIQVNETKGEVQNGVLKALSINNLQDNSSFNMYNIGDGKYQLVVDELFFEIRDKDSLKQISQLESNKRALEKIKLDDKTEDVNELQKKINEIDTKIDLLSRGESVLMDCLVFKPVFGKNKIENGPSTIDSIFYSSLSHFLMQNRENLRHILIPRLSYRLSSSASKVAFTLSLSVEHLSPHRNNQSHLYKINDHSNDINRLTGIHINNPIRKGSDAFKFLTKWMQYFEIGDDYEIKLDNRGDYALIEISENDRIFNLVEKGFGAGQLFTILLSIALEVNKKENFKKINESIIIIEEPEANLHPILQPGLADMFYDAYSVHAIRFIIETHSEYIIRHTQVVGRKNNLFSKQEGKPNPFKVYYFDKEGPYEIKYRTDGIFNRKLGPGGFLDVADQSVVDLYRLNTKDQNNE